MTRSNCLAVALLIIASAATALGDATVDQLTATAQVKVNGADFVWNLADFTYDPATGVYHLAIGELTAPGVTGFHVTIDIRTAFPYGYRVEWQCGVPDGKGPAKVEVLVSSLSFEPGDYGVWARDIDSIAPGTYESGPAYWIKAVERSWSGPGVGNMAYYGDVKPWYIGGMSRASTVWAARPVTLWSQAHVEDWALDFDVDGIAFIGGSVASDNASHHVISECHVTDN